MLKVVVIFALGAMFGVMMIVTWVCLAAESSDRRPNTFPKEEKYVTCEGNCSADCKMIKIQNSGGNNEEKV